MIYEFIEIITPKKFLLQGIWIGSKNVENVIIGVHGLTSNLFSDLKYLPLVDQKTSLLIFNNRGHDIISKLKKQNPSSPKGYDSMLGGTAHEIFNDCIDDIEGALQIAKKNNVKKMFLAGHSTGCQKSVFYAAHKNNQNKLSGIILSCPLSDYAYILTGYDKRAYKKALNFALKMKAEKREHELLPSYIWPSELIDVQRFLSLYIPESQEEIFSYAHDKRPDTYQKITIPLLTIFAGSDEYADRPAKELEQWFKTNTKSINLTSHIIKNAPHNLANNEHKLSELIRNFISTISL